MRFPRRYLFSLALMTAAPVYAGTILSFGSGRQGHPAAVRASSAGLVAGLVTIEAVGK
jgi:hypothetical protein